VPTIFDALRAAAEGMVSEEAPPTGPRDAEAGAEVEMEVGADGGVQLTAEAVRRLGLAPGTRLRLRQVTEGLLLQRADPPLARVYVEPTNACPLHCRTCVRSVWHEPEGLMSMATYGRLIAGLRDVPSLKQISFWGIGEPLLHPNLLEMVELAKELGVRTELITSALLLHEEKVLGLVEAGLDSLVISVDGTSEESQADVRPGADLRMVRKNVGRLMALRSASGRPTPEIGLAFVAMRRNVSELAGLRRLAVSLGASTVTVTNVLPYTEELKDEILYGVSAGGPAATGHSEWWPAIMLPGMDARPEVLDPLLRLLGGWSLTNPAQLRREGAHGYCRFVGQGSVAVSWDGEVSPCIALMHSYPCYVLGRPKQIRRYSLGNAGREDIALIWQRDEFVQFRDRVQRFDFSPCSACGGCTLAESNEEDCYGNPFPVCGDCLWAQGVIQCP